MMRRRRGRQFDPAPIVVYIGIVTAFLMLAVFLHSLVLQTGVRMRSAEGRYQETLMKNRYLQAELMRLNSPESLRNLMKKFGIALVPPQQWSFVQVERGSDALHSGHGDGRAQAQTR